MQNKQPLRVLYSFPHKMGSDRICYTAWQQVAGIADAGAEVLCYPGVLHRPFTQPNIKVQPTLARGEVRVSYKLAGMMRACGWHDYIVARRLSKLVGKIDIVHTWPLGSLRTLKMARKLGLTTVLERPNAHTRFAYDVVKKECDRIGVALPPGHEHEFNATILAKEEEEYQLADGLLCPSDFVARTFRDQDFPAEKLFRHMYGFDGDKFSADPAPRPAKGGLRMIFVGVCAVRKGLHFALEAWLQSAAAKDGTLSIAGSFIPEYEKKLASMLAHPSIRILGHRSDVPDLMRTSDVFVLPSLEEGSALVTSEARASGCVLLVSDAAGANCQHDVNALVHPAGDVATLTKHINTMHSDRSLLNKLRAESLRTVNEITWSAAGQRLVQAYREVLQAKRT
jgi:glycosyltransferase involved in cell wall biosynthesis